MNERAESLPFHGVEKYGRRVLLRTGRGMIREMGSVMHAKSQFETAASGPRAEGRTSSRASRYLHGVRWSVITNFAGSGLAFLTAIVIARLLDPAEYGKYRTVIYLVGLCASVAGFELRDAMRRFIPTLRKEHPKSAGMAVLGALAIAGSLSLLFTLALMGFAGVLGEKVYRNAGLVPLIRWTGLLIAASTGSTMMEAALTGFELYRRVTAWSMLAQAIGFPLQMVLAWRFGVKGAVLGFAIASGLRATLLGVQVFRTCAIGPRMRAGVRDLVAMCGRLLAFSAPLVLTALLMPFANWWMTARLAAHAGMNQVGLFAVAYGLIQLLTTIMLAAGIPLIPVVAEASYSADHETLSRIISRGSSMIVLLLFVPAFALGANAHLVILLCYGQKYLQAAPVLFLFALACLPVAFNEGMSRSLIATGHTKLVVGGHFSWLITMMLSIEFYGTARGAMGCAICFSAAELAQAIYLAVVAESYLRFRISSVVRICAVCLLAMILAGFLSSRASVWSLMASLAIGIATLGAIWKWSLNGEDKALIGRMIPLVRRKPEPIYQLQ